MISAIGSAARARMPVVVSPTWMPLTVVPACRSIPVRPPRMMPPADLGQSLLNLLNNATDASPDNLDIRLDWDAQWIRLTIRDHGAGVPLAIAEQIGRPFITTKGKGFGLGLFLSQASVTRAGGTVKLYNHDEGGTLTELRLPHGSVRA